MIQLNLTRQEIHLLAMALTTQIEQAKGFGIYMAKYRDELILEHIKLRATLLELVK